MSNEMRDELISMGECIGCHKPWEMTVGEKQFFEKMIEKMESQGKRFSMPTHCQNCRNAKKQERGNRPAPEQIISRVESMARKADEGYYSFDGDVLAEDLRNVSKLLKIIFGPRNKNRRENAETPNQESVGQSSESGSVPAES